MPGYGRGRIAGSPPVPLANPDGFASGTCDARLGPRPSRSRRPFRQNLLGGLEDLDRVARGVVHQDLAAAGPADDVVAERQPGGAQPLDLGRDVIDDEVDAVP